MDVASPLNVQSVDGRSVVKTPWIKTVLREPLLHFLLIGAVIFVVDGATRSKADNAHVIVVDDKVRTELSEQFKVGQGRQPTEDELRVLIDRWVYDEVMYREAVALGLDKGDEMFRSRLELKMRAMLIDNVIVNPASDEDLRQWLEANRQRYTAPRRFDFVQFQIEGPEAQAQARAEAVASQIKGEAVPPQYDEAVRIYRDRSQENIASVFGEAFAAGLLGAQDKWVAVHSTTGWHVARLLDDKPPVEPDFDAIKPQLEADWRKFQENRLAREAFHDIRERYDVRIGQPS